MPARVVFKACAGCGCKYHIRRDQRFHSHECFTQSLVKKPANRKYNDKTRRKVCKGCGNIYPMRPRERFHSISCARKFHTRQPKHQEIFRQSVLEREKKRRDVLRASLQQRLEKRLGPQGTLAEAYELGRQDAYHLDWNRAKRLGYAQGFSAAIGEKDDAA